MRTSQHVSLTAALGVRPRELVALVGGGGKSGSLGLLASEALDARSDAHERRFLALTTTGMFLSQLQAVGPVVMGPEREHWLDAVATALRTGGPVAAARDLAETGKVAGVPPEWVDEIWAADLADLVVVESDGSRGLSLKVFGADEPQVPHRTTLVVQVAGLDALGAPIDPAHVHRAELLPSGTGAMITPEAFSELLQLQLRTLRSRWPGARIVTLLNKAEEDGAREAGVEIARLLLRDGLERVSVEAVVVASLQERVFLRCAPDAPLVSAIVLAAGSSRRMGAQKLLLPVCGRPMVEAVVEAASASRASETIVVVGSEREAVRAAVAGYGARVVENCDYATGMSSSLRVGVESARPDRDAVVFLLGDQPFVDAGLIDRLIDHFIERGRGIVRLLAGGIPAHPVLLGAEYLPEIMALQGDVGARDILARHAEDVSYAQVEDGRPARDLDTPDDYRAATECD